MSWMSIEKENITALDTGGIREFLEEVRARLEVSQLNAMAIQKCLQECAALSGTRHAAALLYSEMHFTRWVENLVMEYTKMMEEVEGLDSENRSSRS